jgi:ABC-type oligopeptide transport system substrate-binding subunit
MAIKWMTSSDGLTWRFTLREAQWSDGVPVTAEDVVFLLAEIADPATASPYGQYLNLVKNAEAINAGKLPVTALGIRALGSHELEVRLERRRLTCSRCSCTPVPIRCRAMSWLPRERIGRDREIMLGAEPSC